MNRGYWGKPVTFETLTLGLYRTVASTEEAARVLTDDWPVDEGKAFLAAQTACLAVLSGDGDPQTAREAFLKAAEEAGVFIRP